MANIANETDNKILDRRSSRFALASHVKDESANYDIITLYSQVMQFYKKVVQDEPFLLNKLALAKVLDPDQTLPDEPLSQLSSLRD